MAGGPKGDHRVDGLQACAELAGAMLGSPVLRLTFSSDGEARQGCTVTTVHHSFNASKIFTSVIAFDKIIFMHTFE